MYIVQFENNGAVYYLADWEGDPGRTKERDRAKQFKTDKDARGEATNAVAENPSRYTGKSAFIIIDLSIPN